MTDQTARVAWFARRVAEFAAALPGVRRGGVGAIHRARVAIRRVREALPVLGLDSRAARRASSSLKAVADALAPLREDDVMLELLAGRRRASTPAMDRVVRAIARDRERHFAAVRGRASTMGRRRAMHDLERLMRDVQDLSGPRRVAFWARAVEARVATRAAALETAMDRAGVVYVPAALHRVRLGVKKLRYAIELRQDVRGLKISRQVRTLKSAQAVLGKLHDLESLMARIRLEQFGLGASDTDARVTLNRAIRNRERSVHALHAAYLRDRPKLRRVCAAAGRTASAPSARPGDR